MRAPALPIAGALAVLLTGAAAAHDGVKHETPEEAARHAAGSASALPNTPGFPDVVGGDYYLTDHFGHERSSKDPDGNYQLIFFGYANCKAICSVALPRMAEAVDLLGKQGIAVTPLLITVDPERDTLDAMRETVPEIHPKMIGLTGSEKALGEVYKAFSVEKKLVHEHPTEGPIYAHGTFVYLTGRDGTFKTLMPPVLSPERMTEIVISYAKNEGAGG
ncbi:MAG: SCO family protein [Rhodomicrobiaceae bacterium]